MYVKCLCAIMQNEDPPPPLPPSFLTAVYFISVCVSGCHGRHVSLLETEEQTVQVCLSGTVDGLLVQ